MPSRRASSGELSLIGWPRNRISPASGGCTPVRQRTRVDLPAPLSPSSAVTSPAARVRSTPRSACTASKDLRSPVIRTSGGSLVAVSPAASGLLVASVIGCPLLLEPGYERRAEHHAADRDGLVVLRDTEQGEAVDQALQQDRAGHRAEYRGLPAEQAGPAEHHRRDR